MHLGSTRGTGFSGVNAYFMLHSVGFRFFNQTRVGSVAPSASLAWQVMMEGESSLRELIC